MTTTPPLATGTYWVAVPCPRCGALSDVAVHLGSTLTTPDDGTASLRLVAKSKPVDHWCGQHPMVLPPPDPDLFAAAHADIEERKLP